MKLRKRPAQPLNLGAVEQTGSTSSLTPPALGPASLSQTHASQTNASQTHASQANATQAHASQASSTQAPAGADDKAGATAAASWPSEFTDSAWSLGWADPDAQPVAASPASPPPVSSASPFPSMAAIPLAPQTETTAASGAPAIGLAAPPPGEALAPPAPTVKEAPGAADMGEAFDRPPLRQALSSRTSGKTDASDVPPLAPTSSDPGGQAARLKAETAKAPDVKLDRRETELGLRYRPPRPELGAARYAYLAAGLGALLWSGSFMAFMLAFQRGVAPLTYVPFQSTLLAALTVLPAAFMILAAYAIRQGAWMAAEARTARRLAQDMVLPAAQAASETTSVLEAVRREMDRAASATRAALDEISVLRDTLAQETERLTEAAGDAQRTARVVGETLAHERDEIASLSRELRSNAEDVAAAVSQQTQLVADASDLARSQLQEAEATLVARAADLTAATALAGAAAQDAGDRLAQHTQVLDEAGATLAERLRLLDARLGEQREGLSALVERCNEDQDEIAARLETRRAQLIDTVAEARRGALEVAQSSEDSVDALRDLIAAAAEQMHELVQTAAAERTAMNQNAAESYAAIAEQARYAQEAAATHVEAARLQVEQLGQFAFDAGQRAHQAFEGRISEARRMIEQSAALVEDAGVRSAARIEVGVSASRSALEELGQALAEVDARISKLPDEARSQADAVRVAVERAAADLAGAVRKLSLETKAVDDSFQARVRKSYEALKSYGANAEAAKPFDPPGLGAATPPRSPPRPETRMPDHRAPDIGVGAGAAPLSSKPAAQAPRSDPADLEALRRALAAEEADEESDLDASGRTGDPSNPTDLGLRRRLRLTPTDADAALRSVFDPLQGRHREATPPRIFSDRSDSSSLNRPGVHGQIAALDDWTWKDLLASIDEAPATDDALAGLMIEEISALGVDAGALLPRPRLDEISAAAVSMGPTAVRDTVRRLAPAAVRRLSRRVLTDKGLKDQADRYLRRYADLLQGSIQKDPSVVNALLGSDPGRAYLLLDAAVGDLH